MTTKTISTYVAGGYNLAPRYSELDITSTGGVGGTGVTSSHLATIVNAGDINSGRRGIYLNNGGQVINLGVISGDFGIDFPNALGTVDNSGTISGDYGIGMRGGYVHNSGLIICTNLGYKNNIGIRMGGLGFFCIQHGVNHR